jgi:hypothetical protein
VKALLAVGALPADMHAKDYQGYGRRLNRGRGALQFESDGAMRARAWLCRRTALHHASEKGFVELVKALVESGADVHAKDKYGYGRPLHGGERL